MARPMKSGMDYFSHSTTATIDPKIDAMRAQFGNDGYAFYFMLLEMIYKDGKPLDVSNDAILRSVCNRLMVTEDVFQKMMCVAMEIDLFSRKFATKRIIFSNGTEKRMNFVSTARNSDRTRKKKPSNTSGLDGIPAENYRKTTGIQELSDINKTKQNKTKQKREKRALSTIEKNIISEFTDDPKVTSAIGGYLEMRDNKGKETTEHALKEILIKAKQLAKSKRELSAIFDQSTINCWPDLYALKEPIEDEPAEKIERPEPHHPPLHELPGWESLKPADLPAAPWAGEEELARKFGHGNEGT